MVLIKNKRGPKALSPILFHYLESGKIEEFKICIVVTPKFKNTAMGQNKYSKLHFKESFWK